MKQHYDLVLENEKIRSYRFIRIFLLLANMAGMVWILINASGIKEKIGPALALVAISIFFLLTFVDVLRKKYSYDTFSRVAYVWCAIAWLSSPLWWLSIWMLVFLFLDIMSHRTLIVKISSSGIIYPSMVKKKIEWAELNNLLLKDGLLTVDFKNNRWIQALIANANEDINEKDFNEFCKRQLTANVVGH